MTASEAAGLRPGDYQWDASLAPDGRVNMVVDLHEQRAWVYRGGVLIGISTIASGKPGYETPDGVFKVLEKEKDHHSNKYDDAPMPYMERLTWSGLALHGGHPRGYPASHGCIRLPMGFAASLFKEHTRGMKVVITGQPPERPNELMAGGQSGRADSASGNLQAARFSSGTKSSSAPEEPACCAPITDTDPAVPSDANDEATGNSGDSEQQNTQAGPGGNGSDQQRPQTLPPPPNG